LATLRLVITEETNMKKLNDNRLFVKALLIAIIFTLFVTLTAFLSHSPNVMGAVDLISIPPGAMSNFLFRNRAHTEGAFLRAGIEMFVCSIILYGIVVWFVLACVASLRKNGRTSKIDRGPVT
jgi:surface polysaccharide O-acyltransferase-like enzyme